MAFVVLKVRRTRDRPRTVRHRAIDACDREIITWSGATAGISGEMVRPGRRDHFNAGWKAILIAGHSRLMVTCAERRFGISKAPRAVEWLSDNGSAYIAKDTLHTATALNLNLCFTPVRSPESNGIAEAFVRGYHENDAVRHAIRAVNKNDPRRGSNSNPPRVRKFRNYESPGQRSNSVPVDWS